MDLTRRSFLVGGLSAVALGAGAWGLPGGREVGRPQAVGRLRAPGSLPDPRLPAGTDTLPPIQHIVVLMLENHSWDNLFGMLGRGDGFRLGSDGLPTATNPYGDGRVQRAFHMPTTCQLSGTPSQEWTASHHAYDGGRMDGFVTAPISFGSSQQVGAVAMGYWDGDDLPFTYGLARTFPVGDRWFCSVLGQTYPNRRYLIAGTSAGLTNDSVAEVTATAAPNGTIFNVLDRFGISWANYVVTVPNGATPELYPANDAATESLHARPFDQFFADADAGTLPAFTLLDPNYATQSEENPQDIVVGEAMLAQVVAAVGAARTWGSTLLVVVYDEHGGYYDHVPPPPALAPDLIPPIVQPGELLYDGFRRYGFRVPSVVVSPFARKNHVSHVVYDHTSILAMVQRKWNLPALTWRDANASDLLGFLDTGAMRRGTPTFPALPRLPAPGDTPSRLACEATGPGTIPPPGSVREAAAP